MIAKLNMWFSSHRRGWWFYPACLLICALLALVAPISGNRVLWFYFGFLVMLLFLLRPHSPVYTIVPESGGKGAWVSVIVAVLIIALCTLPMGVHPRWNGQNPGCRNQYELMAEAFLEGHIDFAYGDEDALLVLDNPYDPYERSEAEVPFHFDHAYYNGHYYMYFGVVPVLLVFLPYRVLTGTSLTTYHATQLFVAVSIAGIFLLFRLLRKHFFPKMTEGVCLILSSAFSVISVWYSIAQPALYCTAISAALAMEIWSLYFYIRGVWVLSSENQQILSAGIGALLGALAFGCRPPVALANLLVIPMLIVFLKQRKITGKLIAKLVLAALPYVFVAAGLMWYNYIRFDSPFEFGQSYQLTIADQTQYTQLPGLEILPKLLKDTWQSFFAPQVFGATFPYITTVGVLANFPIFFLFLGLLSRNVRQQLRQTKLMPLVAGTLLVSLIINSVDIIWSPVLLERYHMDFYFLLAIGCFLVIGFLYNSCPEKWLPYLHGLLGVLSVLAMICAVLYCVVGYMEYSPDPIRRIADFLHLP